MERRPPTQASGQQRAVGGGEARSEREVLGTLQLSVRLQAAPNGRGPDRGRTAHAPACRPDGLGRGHLWAAGYPPARGTS